MLQRSGANVGRGPPGNYRAASGSCRCLARRRAARARATAIQASHTVAGTAMPPVHGSAAPMCTRKAVSAVAASMNGRKWVSNVPVSRSAPLSCRNSHRQTWTTARQRTDRACQLAHVGRGHGVVCEDARCQSCAHRLDRSCNPMINLLAFRRCSTRLQRRAAGGTLLQLSLQ
jgi:hypothetical protein